MHTKLKQLIFAASFLATTLLACKKWDEHNKVVNANSTETLMDELAKRSNLSKFVEYLTKTGLDKELNSSKTYTVWAPTNDALQSIDAATVADTAKLRLYLSNHISNQVYFTAAAGTTGLRVPLLNGKRATFLANKFEDANITEANFSVRNGVLHVIDKAVPPLQNLWEYINSTTTQYQQNAFIVSQNFTGFDSTKAVIDSISSTTGLPIYHPGTGIVERNRYNEQVYNLKDETKLYTYFLLNNAAFKVETDSLSSFFKTSTTDSTYNLSAMSVARDAVVEGMYTIDQLPAALTSKFGVTIPIDKSTIVETKRVSNGVVYVVNKLDFLTKQKITNLVVQGENPRGYFRPTGEAVSPTQNSVTAAFFRSRVNPSTGQQFSDIFLYGHGIAMLNVLYQAFNVPAAKYKVYWVAVNDTIQVNGAKPPVVFQQRLAMGTIGATNFPYINVPIGSYSEVYLGDYTQTSYGTLNMYLTAANSTSTGVNSMTLDYIRLEPQF